MMLLSSAARVNLVHGRHQFPILVCAFTRYGACIAQIPKSGQRAHAFARSSFSPQLSLMPESPEFSLTNSKSSWGRKRRALWL